MRYALLLPAVSLLALSGCASMLLSAGTNAGVAVAQNRSIGRTVDDNIIYGDLTTRFVDADENNLLTHVSFNVRFARVMLTGTVENEAQALRATELSWKAKGVTEVINELQVNPDVGFFDKANDTLIKRNLEGRYLITKGVWVINYSMDVQNGVAYLIGRVKDKAELDRALNVARTTKGVKRVVSHLQINTDVERPTTQNGEPSVSAAPSPYANDTAVPAVSSGGSRLGTSSGEDVYTGPVYGSGSISSSPN
jgi:osmotically-inducible protein OsmY